MRRTTTGKLQKVIADNLVSVTKAVVNYNDKGTEAISVDKLKYNIEQHSTNKTDDLLWRK